MLPIETKKPLVNVLIPVYNQNPFHLEACILSVLSQTYPNIHTIVSDNHSTNETTHVLEKYSTKIKIVKPEKFVSINENFAFCASFADGDYISFLSSDDLLTTDAIERLVDVLEYNANCVFAFGNIWHSYEMPPLQNYEKMLIRPNLSDYRVYDKKEGINFFYPWRRSSTWMCGNLIRRYIYEEIGGIGKSTLRVAGDNWLTTELLKYGGFVCIGRPLALFRMRAINHVEVDRDRRLLEYCDRIALKSQAHPIPSIAQQIWQNLNLIQRLGEHKQPSELGLKSAREVFELYGRHDLKFIIDIYDKNQTLFKLLNWPLTKLKNMKNWFQRIWI